MTDTTGNRSRWRRWASALRAPISLAGLLMLAGPSGCSDSNSYFGTGEVERPLPGDRIPIMLFDLAPEADSRIKDLPVILPRPAINPDWPQPGGDARHAMEHPQIGDDLREAWSADIGKGSGDMVNLVAAPVVAGGMVFAIDAEGLVTARSAETGARIWSFESRPAGEEETVFGGGITVGEGKLFVTTGYGEAIALDARTGEQVWRQRLPGLLRAAGTVADGRLFVVTMENQTVALSTTDGTRLWSHAGIAEVSALLGGASPAVGGGAVIAPYSSGELFVLKVENGRMLWAESLTRVRSFSGVANMADIRGHPVVDDGLVLAVSHAGRMFATDLNSGTRIWETRLASVNTPWVAGDFIFTLSTRGEVLALTRRDGRVRWVARLPEFAKPESRDQPIQYAGPLLAGDRLLVASSEGELTSISPYTGEVLGRLKVGGAIFIPPIVADGTVYVLRDDAKLVAFR